LPASTMYRDDELIASSLAVLREALARPRLAPSFHDPKMVVVHAALRQLNERREVYLAYWMGPDYRLIDIDEIAIGTDETVSFSMSFVVRRAVQLEARYVALVHNHPNGDPRPSKRDKESVPMMDGRLSVVGVMAWHLIVADRGYCDIRTEEVTYFPTLAEVDASAPNPVVRCPYCCGPLDSHNKGMHASALELAPARTESLQNEAPADRTALHFHRSATGPAAAFHSIRKEFP